MFFYFFLIFSCANSQILYSKEKLLNDSDCDCGIKYDEDSDEIPPWQLTLKFQNFLTNKTKICGGIILNKKFILTAANCFYQANSNTSKPLVSLSRKIFFEDTFEHFKLEIEKVAYYYSFSYFQFNEYHYTKGFALVELKEYLIFNKNLKPACLIETDYPISFFEKRLFMGGWGTETYYLLNELNDQIYPSKMRDIYSNYFQIKRFSAKYLYYANQAQEDVVYKFCFSKEILCATPRDKSACYGDEGSPLFYEKSGKIYIAGMNILNYPLYVNNSIADVPLFGYCIPNTFNMFLRIEAAYDLISKYVGLDAICSTKAPLAWTKGLKKSIPKKNSFSSNLCQCSSPEITEQSLNLLVIGVDNPFIMESSHFNWIIQIIAFVKDKYKFVCTGVIINEWHILIKASCLFDYGKQGLFVYKINKPFKSTNYINKEEYIKVEKYFFYPLYNVYLKKAADNIAVVRLSEKINFFDNLNYKPACFPRNDDISDYDSDFLFTLSWDMKIPDFEYPDKKLKNPLFVMQHKIVGDAFYIDVEACVLKKAICIKTKKGISLGKHSGILHRFVRNSVQVIGFYSKKKIIENSDFQINIFTKIKPKLNWIYNYIGGPLEICEIDESNKVIDLQLCTCEYSLSNIDNLMPWYVTIIKGYGPIKEFTVPLCRGIVLNDYWILSTAECYLKHHETEFYVVLNMNNIESKFFFLHGLESDKIIQVDYVIYHPGYTLGSYEHNIALFKLSKKIVKKNSNFLPACIIDEDKNVNYEHEITVTQIDDKLLTLKYLPSSLNCYNKEFLCFEGLESPICEFDNGSPVIRIIEQKSYVIGFLYEKNKNEKCSNKTEYQFIKLTNKMSWINSVIGEYSYCIEDSFALPEKENLCDCLVKNTEALVTKHSTDLTLVVLCSCIILSEFYCITTLSCLSENFHVKNWFIVTDARFLSEGNIYISDLKYPPYAIHSTYKNGSLTLLRTLKKMSLGEDSLFFPACLSKNKAFTKMTENSFLFLNSRNSRSYLKLSDKKQYCDNQISYCVTSEHWICNSETGLGVKKILTDKDNSLTKYIVTGLFEKLNSSNNLGIVHRLYYQDSWITNLIGIGRICKFGQKKPDVLDCNCQFKNPLGRIFNGTIAKPAGIFSFMAHIIAVKRDNITNPSVNLVCGGVIIHKNWILTSKNAVARYAIKEIYAATGTVFDENFRSYEIKSNLKTIKNVIYHNDKNVDLALIQVYPEFTFGERTGIHPACIAKNIDENYEQSFLFVLGFGYNKPKEKMNEKISVNLKMFKFTKYSPQNRMQKFYPELCNKQKLCLLDELNSVCAGDAGGPLVQIRNNAVELIGIVLANSSYEWGYQSDQVVCINRETNIFTVISNYYSWLISITKAKNFCQVD